MSEDRSGRRVVIVTGGASGIGKALAVGYARAGVDTVFAYHPADPHDPQATVAAVEAEGGSTVAVAADVTSTAACDSLAATALERFGRIDGVVANAGILRRSTIEEMSDEKWGEVLDVDLTGVMRVFRSAIPHLGAGAALVAVSSMSGGVYGWAEHAHYTAAKAGVIGLVRSLAIELGSRGIRANTVIPGLVETPQSLDEVNSLGAERLRELAAGVPLRRVADPSEVADLIIYLTGPTASYITGADIRIDGGLTIRQAD
jgi:3-oxoacyl-[acyl-carrier protein] reductase